MADDVGDEIVGYRPRRVRALELHQDRSRLGVADPDRQELVPLSRLEEDDRLLPDEVEADAVDDHLVHQRASPHPIIARGYPLKLRWNTARSPRPEPRAAHRFRRPRAWPAGQ